MATGEGFKSEFHGGMSQDISKVKFQPNKYYEAINFRPNTTSGLSETSMENPLGNIKLTTIPDAPESYKIQVLTNGLVAFTISNGATVLTSAVFFTITDASTTEDLYNYINNNYTGIGTFFNVSYNSLYVILNPLNNLVSSIISSNSTLASISVFMPLQSNLEVIGSTHINDDLYILTTNNKQTAPTNSTGQIWKLDIDYTTNLITSIRLVYHNYLNFSTYNAIAPSAIIGRYENASIKRIYWTDNYNKLRSLNVADPQVFATDLSVIDIVPSIDFEVPIMTDISSANGTAQIPIGCYQLAYKLSNIGGASSTYSLPSNVVFVVQGYTATATPGSSEEFQTAGNLWMHYHGDKKGTTTTKRITWNINNIDRQFDRIEAVILIRETKDEIPVIKSIFEGPISADTMDIIFDGDIYNSINTTTVSLEEFLQLSNSFTHCKTIGTKDNRLIAGNVRIENEIIDYDARVYRFNAASTFDIIDNGVKTTNIIVGNPLLDYQIPEESDAINPFNLDATLFPTLYDTTSKYRLGGIIPGGDGPNISYEFVSVAIACDKTVEPINPQPLPIVSTNPDYSATAIKLNLSVNSSDSNGVDSLQEYNIAFPSPINDGMKFPQMNSIYWGYQHNEIYRISIEFWNKSKDQSFVKWIGDIKFPDYFDFCPAANNIYKDGTQTGLTDYRKSFTNATQAIHPSNEAFVCQLGLKLNITIPESLTSKISGYSIVRVKREESDKTVIAEGIISSGMLSRDGVNFYIPEDNNYLTTPSYPIYMSRLVFHTPNILDSSLTTPSSGMKIKCSSMLTKTNALLQINIQGGESLINGNQIYKMYTHSPLPIPAFENDILYSSIIGLDSTINSGSDIYMNNSEIYAGVSWQVGGISYIIKTQGTLNSANVNGYNKYLIYIYNAIINQYGGNTYTQRSNNEYIVCSHFRSIKTSNLPYNDTSLIYGGDIVNDVMDSEIFSYRLGNPAPGNGTTSTFFYPSSSVVNSRLRHGNTPNVSLDQVSLYNNTQARVDYFYNKVYSCQNDIIKLFPKPDPFILNNEYNNRFYISDIKINGEIIDAWSIFKSLNYWDVDGNNGPINGIVKHRNDIYFIQDKAFGKLLVNPKTAIQGTDGVTIQIGRGNVIDSHEYVSEESGSIHQFSLLKSDNAVYFIDSRHGGKMYQFSDSLTPISEVKEMHSWFLKNIIENLKTTDRPVFEDPQNGINGIHGVYDYINNELIYTIKRSKNLSRDYYETHSYTIVFNEKYGYYSMFLTQYPKNYITNNKVIISPNPDLLQDLYIHNVGEYGKIYDIYRDSSIEFIVNPIPEVTKIFNNLLLQTEVQDGNTLVDTDSGLVPIHETFDSIIVSNDHQSSGNVILTAMSNIVRFFRSWRLKMPVHNQQSAYTSAGLYSRMTDKYIKIKLKFANNANKRFIFSSAITYFRKHLPI